MSPITSNLGISYFCLIILGSVLRKWQAAYGISFFIKKKKNLEILGHFSPERQKPHSIVLYQQPSSFIYQLLEGFVRMQSPGPAINGSRSVVWGRF